MGLVFAAIAPHGGLAIAEACEPHEIDTAAVTRAGMEELGRAFEDSMPDVVVIASPHNVHISGAIGVIVAARMAGHLPDGYESVALDLACDASLAWLMLDTMTGDGLSAVGVSFGANDPSAAVAPMDWGVLIPLWFMGGRMDPPVPLVVVAPSRDPPAEAHVRAGAAIARAAATSGKRVAFVASADHGHAHRAGGPYGYHPDAKAYDELVCKLVRTNRLDELSTIPLDLVETAKADSWWQMLMLSGATGDGWTGRLISYEAPTYFGMLTALYLPADRRSAGPRGRLTPGTSSRPGTRTRRRTRAL